VAPIALSVGETILLIALAAVPFAILAFVLGARGALGQIGSGPLSIEQEPQPRGGATAGTPETREAEVRQMVEAKAYRRRRRGGGDLDVDAEVDRLLDAAPGPEDAELAAEVRQLVIARNERRERRGEQPLDVESEVARRLAELRELGS